MTASIYYRVIVLNSLILCTHNGLLRNSIKYYQSYAACFTKECHPHSIWTTVVGPREKAWLEAMFHLHHF